MGSDASIEGWDGISSDDKLPKAIGREGWDF